MLQIGYFSIFIDHPTDLLTSLALYLEKLSWFVSIIKLYATGQLNIDYNNYSHRIYIRCLNYCEGANSCQFIIIIHCYKIYNLWPRFFNQSQLDKYSLIRNVRLWFLSLQDIQRSAKSQSTVPADSLLSTGVRKTHLIVDHLAEHQLFSDVQWGFLPRHSTASALLSTAVPNGLEF